MKMANALFWCKTNGTHFICIFNAYDAHKWLLLDMVLFPLSEAQ